MRWFLPTIVCTVGMVVGMVLFEFGLYHWIEFRNTIFGVFAVPIGVGMIVMWAELEVILLLGKSK